MVAGSRSIVFRILKSQIALGAGDSKGDKKQKKEKWFIGEDEISAINYFLITRPIESSTFPTGEPLHAHSLATGQKRVYVMHNNGSL